MARTIIWDFNGTVLDDVDVCIEVINSMQLARGLEQLTKEKYLEIFDFPVIDYYRRAGFDFIKESFDAVAEEYIIGYRFASRRCGLHNGVMENLLRFKDNGDKQILLSASSLNHLKEQSDHLGVTPMFDTILGLNNIKAASKLSLALEWLKKERTAASDAVMIGDTVHDYEVATALGCRCILVCGGHNSRARLEKTGAEVISDLTWLHKML